MNHNQRKHAAAIIERAESLLLDICAKLQPNGLSGHEADVLEETRKLLDTMCRSGFAKYPHGDCANAIRALKGCQHDA